MVTDSALREPVAASNRGPALAGREGLDSTKTPWRDSPAGAEALKVTDWPLAAPPRRPDGGIKRKPSTTERGSS
ncbi:hypothetical protein MKX07_000265 [Trichoderma sp. CBMAI-0711]|nr:hypothetical protein MKX07_000265 [Trichoderma sp. CBMAI-0711]